MAKKHTFIISDETLNSYGFRVLTDGIDYSQYEKNPIVLFMHNRAWNPENVVGKGSNIRKEGTKLLMDVEFDQEDDYALKLEGKVKRGFIKMASISGSRTEVSEAPEDLLPGQTRPTVKKMKLKEVSIVDIGSNDEALRLYDETGAEIQLSDMPVINNEQQLSENKKMEKLNLFVAEMSVALGLPTDTTSEQLKSHVSGMKQKEVKLSAELKKINDDKKASMDKEALELCDEAVKLGVVPEHLKGMQLAAFGEDFDKAKVELKALVDAAKPEEKPEGGEGKEEIQLNDRIKNFLDDVKPSGGEGKELKLSDLSEKQIAEMQEKNPEKLEELIDGYEGTQF